MITLIPKRELSEVEKETLKKRKEKFENYNSEKKAIRKAQLMSKLFNINFDINKNGTIVKNVSNVDGEIVTLNTVTNVSETKTEIKTPKTKAEKVAKSKAKKQSKTDVKYIGFDKVKKGKNKGSSVKIHKKYDATITELLRKERVLKKQLSALRKEGIKETDSSYIAAMKTLSDTTKSKKEKIENQKTTK